MKYRKITGHSCATIDALSTTSVSLVIERGPRIGSARGIGRMHFFEYEMFLVGQPCRINLLALARSRGEDFIKTTSETNSLKLIKEHVAHG